ncbi:MAG: adenylate kinase family protein [Actinomycetota bacterium]
MRIVMLGPPASGKGTQGIRLAQTFGVPHISSGQLLRRSMDEGDSLGIGAIVARGELVPDELVEHVVLPALGGGFVLDGYPRTQAQAARLDAELDRRGLPVEAAVEIDVYAEVLAERMALRAQIESRPDDRPDAFARRLEDYRAEAGALRRHYEGRFVTVDGNATPDEVQDRLVAALRDAGVRELRA